MSATAVEKITHLPNEPRCPVLQSHTVRGSGKPAKAKSVSRGPSNVAQAVVIKDEDVFFLCDRSGNVPLGNEQGFGLYYHDCRFLQGYEVSIAGNRLNSLV